MRNRVLKTVAIGLATVMGILVCVVAIALVVLQVRTNSLHDNLSHVTEDAGLREPVAVDGVEVISQDISCGYAVIEMFSKWDGGNITEEALFDEYGSVVTSTGGSFCDEMNKRFPAYKTSMRKYLTDSELLSALHESLKAGVPVPLEWAAKLGDEWTLHYSLVTGMDLAEDRVVVANPYGYTEELIVDDFLGRTSFEAYENMPLFLRLGFAFGVFEKNTLFIPSRSD